MSVLLDACVWGGVGGALFEAGHDVTWAGDWPVDPGDEEILERARLDEHVLVTLDKDFRELAIVRRVPHRSIVRLVALSISQVRPDRWARHSRGDRHGRDILDERDNENLSDVAQVRASAAGVCRSAR